MTDKNLELARKIAIEAGDAAAQDDGFVFEQYIKSLAALLTEVEDAALERAIDECSSPTVCDCAKDIRALKSGSK